MAAKRLLAVLAAIGLVAGALLLRQFIDGGGDLSRDSNVAIVCDRAIEDQCRSAFTDHDLTIEDPGVTFDRLVSDDDPEPVVWIAADLWFEMLSDARSRGVLRWDVGTPELVAETPLVFAGPAASGCDPTTWACLAAPDADLTVGISDPASTSVGLETLGWLAFTRQSGTGGALSWNNRAGSELTTASVTALLNYRNASGRFDLSVVSLADFETRGPLDDVPTVPDAPSATLTVGALGVDASGIPDLGALGDELELSGWATEGTDGRADGPTGGSLIALRDAWS